MRELNPQEIALVAGGDGTGVCTPENSYGGVSDPNSFGQDLINLYEGLVFFTSHVIERVALAM